MAAVSDTTVGPPGPAGGRLLHWPWMMLPLLAAAASRGLWAPDEPRYAQVARELWQSGDWLVLHLCGEPYPDKPPLFFWLLAVAGRSSGWSELALRLPSLLASFATAWITGALARRWWGALEAGLAPALCLGTLLMTHVGSRVQLDPLLTLTCTAALALADAPARTRELAARRARLVGLLTGLAALTKGPVAWVIVALVLAAWKVARLGEGGAAARARDVAGGVLLATIPVGAWAALVLLREPSLARSLLFGQHAGRALEALHHPGPPWEHAVRLPLYLFPWSLPILLGLLHGVGTLRFARAERDRGLARAALWCLVPLVFFSLVPEKRDLYLLPLLPAAALAGARWLGRAWEEGLPALVGWFGVGCLALLAALLCGLAPAAGLAGGELLARVVELDIGWRAMAAGIAFAAATWLAARSLRARSPLRWTNAMLAGWACAGSLALGLILPRVDRDKSPRELALWVAALEDRPASIPCWGVRPEGFRFYGDLPTVPVEDLRPRLASADERFLALVEDELHAQLSEPERARLRVLRRERIGSLQVLVLRLARAGENAR